MANKKSENLTAEQAAEKAKPNWKAVAPIVTDVVRRAESDEAAPELAELARKYLGKTAPAKVKAARVKKGNSKNDLKLIVMEPKTPSDARVGRKAVLVNKDGKIVGEQG